MPYSYPAPRTGTSQDLFQIVTRAYERELEASGARLPEKSEAARRWIEPAFRAIGVGIAVAMEMVPADWDVALHDRLFAFLAAPRSYPFDADSPVVARARALATDLERRAGRAPALLALISHPPSMGDLAHLNFELVRHATLALRAVLGRPCRPRLVTAIDPFALDTASIIEEGLYAGFMGTFHLGVDRLALGRGHPGVALTPRASWTAMPMRLLRVLADGGEVGMVPSGGVPSTGRVLYGVREWARMARARSPLRGRPEAIERALRANPSFARFERATASAPRARLLDMWLMTVAAGLLPGETLEAVAAAALSCLAVPAEERRALLDALAHDMERETPRRSRLFRLLAGRVARRRPLLMIPIVHHVNPLAIATGEAWSWEWAGQGRLITRRADAMGVPVAATPEAFANRFVEENFP